MQIDRTRPSFRLELDGGPLLLAWSLERVLWEVKEVFASGLLGA